MKITHLHVGAIHGFSFDWDSDALYVRLSDEPYHHGKDLDAERRVDFAADGTPIGVEITCLSAGVRLNDLPNRDEIGDILTRFTIPLTT